MSIPNTARIGRRCIYSISRWSTPSLRYVPIRARHIPPRATSSSSTCVSRHLRSTAQRVVSWMSIRVSARRTSTRSNRVTRSPSRAPTESSSCPTTCPTIRSLSSSAVVPAWPPCEAIWCTCSRPRRPSVRYRSGTVPVRSRRPSISRISTR